LKTTFSEREGYSHRGRKKKTSSIVRNSDEKPNQLIQFDVLLTTVIQTTTIIEVFIIIN